MRAEVRNITVATMRPEVVIEHKGKTLVFIVSSYGRKCFTQGFDTFEHLNQYWASRKEKEQDQFFEYYEKIMQVFLTEYNHHQLTMGLASVVGDMMALFDFDTVHQWSAMRVDLHVPAGFEKEYVESVDNGGSRGQTYLRSDYTKLVALAIIIRTMIPVWGEYITRTRQESGTRWKEMSAFQIFSKATNILECDAYQKLETFVRLNSRDEAGNMDKITNGISSEDFHPWLMSRIMVKRLCVGDVRGADPRGHLVSYVHQFVLQQIKGGDTQNEKIVRPKKSTDGGSDDLNSKLSAMESYKQKFGIADGEIVELEYSVSDIRRCANRLSPVMDPQLLERSLETVKVLHGHRLMDSQTTLLKWVFKEVISPRGIDYLSEAKVIEALGASQAVLWSKGYHWLALFITSFPNVSDDVMHMDPGVSRTQIPKEMVAEIERIFPFQLPVFGKKSDKKNVNDCVKAINTLADDISMYSWTMTAEEDLIRSVIGHTNTRRLPQSCDVKVDLARLVISLGNRTFSL